MPAVIYGLNHGVGNLPIFTAYLDPGTGSMIMQMIVFAVVAIGAFVKIYWGKIKGLFSRGKK